MPKDQSILILAVNYGTDDEARGFAASIASLEDRSSVIPVIVDNTPRGESDSFSSELQSVCPGIVCLNPSGNLGYFGGAAHGLAWYLKEHPWPDWVMVSNVDIRIESPDFFKKLLDLESCDSVGLVGPSIRSSLTWRDSNPQYVERLTAARVRRYKVIFRYWILLTLYEMGSRVKRRLSYVFTRLKRSGSVTESGDDHAERPQPVYSIHGSCILLSRRFFDSGGSLEYPCFLFGEELFLAEQSRKLGLQTYYHPGMRVIHNDHSSTGVFRSRHTAKCLHDSAVYIADTFFADEE